jgi:hypothetical protein
MIWEIFPHDKQWHFYGTKFLEVARSGFFVARNGKPLFPQRRRREKNAKKIETHDVEMLISGAYFQLPPWGIEGAFSHNFIPIFNYTCLF